MAKFTIQNLPKGFVYLVPRPRLRPLIKRFEAHFAGVDYDGVSMSEQNVAKWKLSLSMRSFHLGILHTCDDEAGAGWRFRLTLNGVRECNLPDDPEEIAATMLKDIEARVLHIIALPPAASRSVGDLYLGYQVDNKAGKVKYHSFVPE